MKLRSFLPDLLVGLAVFVAFVIGGLTYPKHTVTHTVYRTRTVTVTAPAATTTTAPPTTVAPTPPPVIQEDDPRWDCRTMGNHICGIAPLVTTPGQPGYVSTTNVPDGKCHEDDPCWGKP